MKRLVNQTVAQGLNASQDFLNQFNNPSASLLGTINAIYEYGHGRFEMATQLTVV